MFHKLPWLLLAASLFAADPIRDASEERAMSRALVLMKDAQANLEDAKSKWGQANINFNQANDNLGRVIDELRKKYNASSECVPVMDLDPSAPELFKWQCPTKPAPVVASAPAPAGSPHNVTATVTPGGKK